MGFELISPGVVYGGGMVYTVRPVMKWVDV